MDQHARRRALVGQAGDGSFDVVALRDVAREGERAGTQLADGGLAVVSASGVSSVAIVSAVTVIPSVGGDIDGELAGAITPGFSLA